jgi:hypothetical protein
LLPDQQLIKKQSLCEEVLEVFNKIIPGNSRYSELDFFMSNYRKQQVQQSCSGLITGNNPGYRKLHGISGAIAGNSRCSRIIRYLLQETAGTA